MKPCADTPDLFATPVATKTVAWRPVAARKPRAIIGKARARAGIEARFDEFDRLNPAIWEMFKRYAIEALVGGRQKIASKMIVERIRWERNIATVGVEPWKINNSFTAHYARKFVAEFPKFTGAFEMRALRRRGVAQ